jgi:molybdopterin molybdotransferase
MDGYAVRAGDLSQCPHDLRLTGEVAAGGGGLPRVEQGACVRILTGAVVPPGADTVVKVEQTSDSGDVVTFLEAPQPGANIRRQGEEVRRGQIILEEAAALGPAQIGLCASVGKDTVRVHGRPRPTVLCTGEELREVHESVEAHQLRDSNGPALCAALAEAGYHGVGRQIVRDDLDLLAGKIETAAADHDVVILTGGVSVGKYDFVPDAIKRLGATVHFHGVGMKPGKPQLYATLDGGRHLFGLPGNPLSVLTGFYAWVVPAQPSPAAGPGCKGQRHPRRLCPGATDLRRPRPARRAGRIARVG